MIQRSLEVAHGQAFVHRQAFDLVKHRGVGRVEFVGPVDPSGRHDVDRQRTLEHRANLNG